MRILDTICNLLSAINLKTYHKLIYCFSLSFMYGFSKYVHYYYERQLKAVRLQCIDSEHKKDLKNEDKHAGHLRVIQGKFDSYLVDPYKSRIDNYSAFLMKDERNKILGFYNNFRSINFREYRVEKLSLLARIMQIILNLETLERSYSDYYFKKYLFRRDQVTALLNLNKFKYANCIVQGNIINLIESIKEKVNMSKYALNSSLALLVLSIGREIIELIWSLILRKKKKNVIEQYRKLKETNPDLLNLFSCHSCKSNLKQVINLRCGHFVLCFECFKLNKVCQICNKNSFNYAIYT